MPRSKLSAMTGERAVLCHCEEQSDEAISKVKVKKEIATPCGLAMTGRCTERCRGLPHSKLSAMTGERAVLCHCEEQSDEAISRVKAKKRDCHAPAGFAMTGKGG